MGFRNVTTANQMASISITEVLRKEKAKIISDYSVEIYGNLFFPKKIMGSENKEKIAKYLELAIHFSGLLKIDVNQSFFQVESKMSSDRVKLGINNLIEVLNNISISLFEREELNQICENFSNIFITKSYDFSTRKNGAKKLAYIGALNVLYINILKTAAKFKISFPNGVIFPCFNKNEQNRVNKTARISVMPPKLPPKLSPNVKPQQASEEDEIYATLDSVVPKFTSTKTTGRQLTVHEVFMKYKSELNALIANAEIAKKNMLNNQQSNLIFPSHILVCCKGNHTRSPVAEAILRALLHNCCSLYNINVYSAGLGIVKKENSREYRVTYTNDTRYDNKGTTTANTNSIKVVEELCRMAPRYFEGADQGIQTHIARDIENAYYIENTKINWDLNIVMEESQKEVIKFWRKNGDAAKIPQVGLRLRIRKLRDPEFILLGKMGITEPIYDPQKDFHSHGPQNSYPMFVEMLDTILGLCIKWAQVILKGTWKNSLEIK
ncbi:hypothetical protein [Silvanigrella aquatica]|uniref:Phosphotyrosine protein phosphatase I domain-containing protein n=1 Tax=Silvanigrella aquatica TaxID=1915309 RepID=A0A1L4CYI2_9BACT|nr:hypothetical protein [Silvanigrella aquatica]APJ03009.1 hypothetical protein AXG55_03395 [Silvanigrella aquatica]